MAHTGIKIGVLAALAVLFPVPGLVQAQNIADSPCDMSYYKSLESRAWLEAQREITQNQNLIYKPDSVLAYTCFDQFARVTANMQSWQGFSETSRWGNVISPLTTAVDEAMTGLVGPSLYSYLNVNFNNAYMGGRGGDSYKPSSSNISGGSYTCDQMNRIWQSTKCYNFQTREHDGFFTFEQHRQEDKRRLPNACVNPTAEWQEHIKESGLNPNSAPAWPFDKVQVYYDRLKPENCADSTPLATGVMITTSVPGRGPEPKPEKICIIPGCYFDIDGGKCAPTGG